MQLGQLMIIGFEGTKASDELLSFIRDEGIGGVILFKRNYESARQLKNLISELQEAGEGKLFVSIDHEGGRVMRLNKPFTHFGAAARVAEQGAQAVYEVGFAMAKELSDVGINLDFAPVLDVATNIFNTVIGDRSYGGDPAIAAELAIQMMKGLMDGGVIACGKHFPGHGDTDIDSHLALPVLPHTKRRLDICELVPFKAAIAAGVPMMMTAHILIPSLDANWPASISRCIVHELLRRDLGFEGVIITDDLRMKGISNFLSIPDAACRAIEAGHDMIMICRDLDLEKQVLDHLKKVSDDGKLIDLEKRFKRIDDLKARVHVT